MPWQKRLSKEELAARWTYRGEHPRYTRERHDRALRGVGGRTQLPVETDYWQWVSDQTADQFLRPEPFAGNGRGQGGGNSGGNNPPPPVTPTPPAPLDEPCPHCFDS